MFSDMTRWRKSSPKRKVSYWYRKIGADLTLMVYSVSTPTTRVYYCAEVYGMGWSSGAAYIPAVDLADAKKEALNFACDEIKAYLDRLPAEIQDAQQALDLLHRQRISLQQVLRDQIEKEK